MSERESVRAWAILQSGIEVSIWLSQEAAEKVITAYKRNVPKSDWRVVPVEIRRLPAAKE